MKLTSFIARRYLFAKKSHNVINIISIISAAGIAVGCAALVVILSVYNGFDSVVRELNNSYTADILIKPAEGKVFSPDSTLFDRLDAIPEVKAACGVVEESVFIQYGDNNKVVTAKGVDNSYEEVTGLRDYLVEGVFKLTFGQINQVVLGRTIALEMGIRTAFLQSISAYFPSRTGDVDMLNPLSSLRKETLYPGGIVSLEQAFDQKYMFMPLDAMRELLEYEDEVSSIEIYLAPEGLTSKEMAKKSVLEAVAREVGDGFTVLDKQQQNSTLYRLLKYEKVAVFLILLFVMLIISFNIFGSLSMLIIDKHDDIGTLRAMGADNNLIKKIFVHEGWMITLCGIAVGLIAGLLICWLQIRFGIVKMPGNFVVDSYPVSVQWQDIVVTAAGVGLIGYIIARMTKGRLL